MEGNSLKKKSEMLPNQISEIFQFDANIFYGLTPDVEVSPIVRGP
jgi:hypothetical protein